MNTGLTGFGFGVASTAARLAALMLVCGLWRPVGQAGARPTAKPVLSQPEVHLLLGDSEETALPAGQFGITNAPDGSISFLRAGGELHVWFPCGVSTCYLHGSSPDSLRPRRSLPEQPGVVLAPTGRPSDFDADYAGITSVISTNDGRELIGIYHGERHPCNGPFPFVRGIGVAHSRDGGLTWTREGEVARSGSPGPRPGDCSFGVFGPGDPSVVVSRDGRSLLAYFNERIPGKRDAIYLARAPLNGAAAPGSWLRYVNGRFSASLLGGAGDPVISAAPPASKTIYAAMGSVSWNVFAKRYVAITQSMDGFYYATSSDGLHWGPLRLLLPSASWNDPKAPASARVAIYPSLLSFDQPSQLTTSQTGYLYYARSNKANNPPHYMVRRRFTIEVADSSNTIDH